MATYAEIENLRKRKHYLQYDYYKFGKEYKDEFNISLNATKYPIQSIETGVRKGIVIDQNIANSVYSKLDFVPQPSFKTVETILQQNKMPKNVIDYFKAIMTIGNGIDDDICKNVMASFSTFNYQAILNDLGPACRDKAKMSEMLQTLTAEANAAAVNGLFAKLFQVVRDSGARSQGDFRKVDPEIEKRLVNLYNKTMYGDKHTKPLDIPNDPSKIFSIVKILSKQLRVAVNSRNLSDQQLVNEIIKPFETSINKALNQQKTNGKNIR